MAITVHQERTMIKTETFPHYRYSLQISKVTETAQVYIILKQRTNETKGKKRYKTKETASN